MNLKNCPKFLDYDQNDYRNYCRDNFQINPEKITIKSVIVSLLVDENLFFIRRSQLMPTHKGQVAFVGGHVKKEQSYWENCQREFFEETQINVGQLQMISLMPPVRTLGDMAILPIICKTTIDLKEFIQKLRPCSEWDVAFFIDIKTLYLPDTWTKAQFALQKSSRPIYFRPILKEECQQIIQYCEKPPESFLLWGATGKVCWNLHKMLT